MRKSNQSGEKEELFEKFTPSWNLSRRSFVGRSAAAAGALGLSDVATGSPRSASALDNHGGEGLTTEDIMQMMLDEVGEDVVPPDTGIYVSGDEIETALIGIDIEGTGFQIAQQMEFDVTISHHPIGGWPIVNFPRIFDFGVDIMTDHGVPESRAEEAVAQMREAWHFNALSDVEDHLPSIARLRDQPAMNIHQPVDEISRRRFSEVAQSLSSDATVADLIQAFNDEIPEVRAQRAQMTAAVGREDNEIGNVAVYHGSGTNGGYPVASALFDNGIDTVMYIHIGYGDAQQLREEYGPDKNLVVIGHQPGDGVGMRRLKELLEEQGVEVTSMSGAIVGPDDLPPEEWEERQARQEQDVVEVNGLNVYGRWEHTRADEVGDGEDGDDGDGDGADGDGEDGDGADGDDADGDGEDGDGADGDDADGDDGDGDGGDCNGDS